MAMWPLRLQIHSPPKRSSRTRRLLLLLLFSCLVSSHQACYQGDRASLWSFFLDIYSPPSTPLNWSSADCCFWEGINCDDDGWVTHLRLPFRSLRGRLSPSLANLTRLSHLNLSRNSFSGSVPPALFSSLEILDVSFNRLSGELPPSLSPNNSRVPLQILDLSSNHFNGVIQSSFLLLAGNLTNFNVSNNSFTDSIPSDICSNSPLVRLFDFSYNNFSGQVPLGLGQCSKLEVLRAGFNSLSGLIPDDIYSAASLLEISFPVNGLSGPISDAIVNLGNLSVLELYANQLTGNLPNAIGKLSNLKRLLLHINNLTGPLPSSLMDCTKLTKLYLRVNSFEGDISQLNFSTLQQLTTLDLGDNNFTGNLPVSLYSCKSLTAVRLANNRIMGQILPDILALQSLSFLSISKNNLTNITGAIKTLMGCRNLSTLILTQNFFYERLPGDDSISDSNGFQRLQVLALGGCRFSGQVPTWLAKLRKLEVLDLSQNQITGSLPGWLGTLPSLFYIDMSSNLLSGEFPLEIMELPRLTSEEAANEVDQSYLELPVFVQPNNATNLQYNQLSNLPPAIYLGNNSLNDNIPMEIGRLKFIHILDISHNNFSGNIPDQISNLTNLEKLDLSGNHLSGEIPVSLTSLHFLSSFNVANNSLNGAIPSGGQFDTFPSSSFEGNPGLCGPPLQRSCSSNQPGSTHSSTPGKSISLNKKLIIVGLIVGICFVTGLILALLAFWICKRRILPRGESDKSNLDSISCTSNRDFHSEADKDTSMVIVFPSNNNGIKDLTIAEILNATDNFNQENIIGCGGFGLVYKAVLDNGTKLAIKKLSGDLGLIEREFKAEVEALSTAQHKNLVSLQGYCVHDGIRLLIYSYMENGSLDYWLHEKTDGSSQLDWQTRLNIVRGASCGLAYMHQICEPHIVHRDIKSSNILLNDKFEAHVADFGLSRLILPYHTHVSTELVGTLGYIPPEYGQALVATLRGDVYSFGVVMLELLTGKRPVEVFRPKMSRELVGWVQQMRSEGKQDQVFDPLLRDKGVEEEMLQVLDVACLCVNQNPFKRPTIKEVVNWLENIGNNAPKQGHCDPA